MATYYISPTGDNSNTGLSDSAALQSFRAALTKAASGDEICFLPGVHTAFARNILALYSYSYIGDEGKFITIFAQCPAYTIIDTSALAADNSLMHPNVISLANKDSKIFGLYVIYNPKNDTNYNCAIFGYGSKGKIYNSYFKIIGTSAVKSFSYNNLDDPMLVQNCNFSFEDPQPTNDYSGKPTWVNNIYPQQPTRGTKTYDVIRQATENDIHMVASDCYNVGNPAILNDDGTRSHVGVFGGLYGHVWMIERNVKGVALNKSSTSIPVGGNEQLTASIDPWYATDTSVTWKSSNLSIATVDCDGNITAVSQGTITITVKTTDGGFEALCTVAVISIPMTATINTHDNDNTVLLTSLIPPEGTTTWASSDTSKATVSNTGLVTGVPGSGGNVTITCRTSSGLSSTCIVTVKPLVTKVWFNDSKYLAIQDDPTSMLPEVNITTTCSAKAFDCQYCRILSWQISDTSIATVDSNGIVIGIRPGITTLTVTTNDGRLVATCEISVEHLDLTRTLLTVPNLDVIGSITFSVHSESAVPTAKCIVSIASGDDIDYKAMVNPALNHPSNMAYLNEALNWVKLDDVALPYSMNFASFGLKENVVYIIRLYTYNKFYVMYNYYYLYRRGDNYFRGTDILVFEPVQYEVPKYIHFSIQNAYDYVACMSFASRDAGKNFNHQSGYKGSVDMTGLPCYQETVYAVCVVNQYWEQHPVFSDRVLVKIQ